MRQSRPVLQVEHRLIRIRRRCSLANLIFLATIKYILSRLPCQSHMFFHSNSDILPSEIFSLGSIDIEFQYSKTVYTFRSGPIDVSYNYYLLALTRLILL